MLLAMLPHIMHQTPKLWNVVKIFLCFLAMESCVTDCNHVLSGTLLFSKYIWLNKSCCEVLTRKGESSSSRLFSAAGWVNCLTAPHISSIKSAGLQTHVLATDLYFLWIRSNDVQLCWLHSSVWVFSFILDLSWFPGLWANLATGLRTLSGQIRRERGSHRTF